MREYKIDIGNSGTGQVGAVAYVQARSKAHALQKFNDATGYGNHDVGIGADVKVHVYFNPKTITLQDVTAVR